MNILQEIKLNCELRKMRNENKYLTEALKQKREVILYLEDRIESLEEEQERYGNV